MTRDINDQVQLRRWLETDEAYEKLKAARERADERARQMAERRRADLRELDRLVMG